MMSKRLSCRRVHTFASKGFGSGRSGVPKKVKRAPPGWIQVTRMDELASLKPITAVEAEGKALVLIRSGEKLFCTDANSTAFQFPLVDAKVLEVEGRPALECPLDGTVYDLETGRVIEWCPSNNVLRSFLGKLKEKEKPVNLKVYSVSLGEDGEIYVKV